MVYHMENIGFLKDLYIIEPRFVKDQFNGVLINLGHDSTGQDHDVYHSHASAGQGQAEKEIDRMLKKCVQTETDDGFEACIHINREDLSEKFSDDGDGNFEFDRYLERVDGNIQQIKDHLVTERKLFPIY